MGDRIDPDDAGESGPIPEAVLALLPVPAAANASCQPDAGIMRIVPAKHDLAGS
jgi:hypothetical protein